MPATVTWDGGGGNFAWENALNWSTDALPGAGDDVSISVIEITVTHTSLDPVAVHSLTSQTNIDWQSGSLTLAALNISSGTADFHATPLVLDDLILGSSSGPAAPTLRAGNVTVSHWFDWYDGTLTGLSTNLTIAPSASMVMHGLSMSGPRWLLDGPVLENNGTVRMLSGSAAELKLTSGSLINNYGNFRTENGSFKVIGAGVGAVFNNYGTMVHDASTGQGPTYYNLPVNNSGAVNLPHGNLAIYGGGTSSGTFSAATGTQLNFSGTTVLEPSSQLVSDGGVYFAGDKSTAEVGGIYNVGAAGFTYLYIAQVDFSGTVLSVGQSLTVQNGTADLHATPLVLEDLILSQGDDISTTLKAGNVTVNNSFNWYGGTLTGAGTHLTIAPGAAMVMSRLSVPGPRWFLNGPVLDNYGTARMVSGSQSELQLSSGSLINNYGNFRTENGSFKVIGAGVGAVFNNYGTMVHDASTGQGPTYYNLPVNNSGAVNLPHGNLAIYGGGTSSGTFSAATGTQLNFSGTTVLEPNSQLVSDGDVYFYDVLSLQVSGQSPTLQYDHITANGAAYLYGSFELNLLGGFAANVYDVITVIDGGSRMGTFAGLADGDTITVGGYQFEIHYTGCDVTLTVIVSPNTAPTANAGGPYTVVRGGSIVLDASGSSDPDQHTTTLIYQWDFDGDSQFDDAIGMYPTYSAIGLAVGTYSVGLRVTDDHDVSASTTATIQVVESALLPDPCEAGKFALFVGGTTGNDNIVITPIGNSGAVQVLLNGTSLGIFTPTGRIVAYGQAGHDDLQIAGGINTAAWLYGGIGNDRLKGGDAADVLDGEAGNDLLVGGGGRDLLIGGTDADRIVGNADDDILIAGFTTHDDDPVALCHVMDEWTRTDANYAQRIANLVNGGGQNGAFVLNGITVGHDTSADVLTGSSGLDWFLFNDQQDRVTDLNDEAFVNDLTFING